MRASVISSLLATAVIAGLAGCTADDADGDDAAGSEASVIQPGKPGESNRHLSPDEVEDAAPDRSANDADVEYVTMMIMHHQQAIDMTDLADEHANGRQVTSLASRIADSQGPEITMMNTWLKRNGEDPVDVEEPDDDGDGEHGHGEHGYDHDDMPGMASHDEMEELASARGASFDHLFLELMITHHEGALTMAREVQTQGSDVQVQQMADDVIASQAAEINRMKALQGDD